MKKYFLTLAAFAMALSFGLTSCSEDEPNSETPAAAEIDYTSSNAAGWGNYMRIVADLLRQDATELYNDWSVGFNGGESYATVFKNHQAPFSGALSCVEQLIDGCVDIANEVGTAKIGEPFDLYKSGQTQQALYAVESWYSWHSRDDYRNNIYSIRNAYYGSRNGSISEASLAAAVTKANPTLDAKVKAAIKAAADAIYAIPDPFRNHIASAESEAAMDACEALSNVFKNDLKGYVTSELDDDAILSAIVANYVDVVVLPTYKDLKDDADKLYQAVVTFANNPSNANFSAAAEAWLAAREPWETSEAFLFGPVADKGLDPNMDSWPLDQEGIVQILNSGNFNNLNWDGDYDEESETIGAAQSLRGFHTLEFLLFKDGKPRRVE